jgi:hypothetical protein
LIDRIAADTNDTEIEITTENPAYKSLKHIVNKATYNKIPAQNRSQM